MIIINHQIQNKQISKKTINFIKASTIKIIRITIITRISIDNTIVMINIFRFIKVMNLSVRHIYLVCYSWYELGKMCAIVEYCLVVLLRLCTL